MSTWANRNKAASNKRKVERPDEGEYSVRLKSWETKVSQSGHDMFVVIWTVTSAGPLKGKPLYDRFLDHPKAPWRVEALARLSATLGVDLDSITEDGFEALSNAWDALLDGPMPRMNCELVHRKNDDKNYDLKYDMWDEAKEEAAEAVPTTAKPAAPAAKPAAAKPVPKASVVKEVEEQPTKKTATKPQPKPAPVEDDQVTYDEGVDTESFEVEELDDVE